MHFGKHKGKLLHEIDRDYVLWMQSEDVLASRYHRNPDFVEEMKWVFPDIFEHDIGHPDFWGPRRKFIPRWDYHDPKSWEREKDDFCDSAMAASAALVFPSILTCAERNIPLTVFLNVASCPLSHPVFHLYRSVRSQLWITMTRCNLSRASSLYIDLEPEDAITRSCSSDRFNLSLLEQYQCEYIRNRLEWQRCWPQRRMSNCHPGSLKGVIFLYHGYSAGPAQYNDLAFKFAKWLLPHLPATHCGPWI